MAMKQDPPVQPTQPTTDMLALLASNVDSGLILCCGEALEPYCRQISKAMPMTTRLVLNVETDTGYKASQSLSALDIRIAVHKQDKLGFLDDISRYFFNLVLIESDNRVTAVIEQLKDRLMPGGIFVVLNSDVEHLQACLPEPDWHAVKTGWPDQAVIVRARSANAQPTQRKGGRRARIHGKTI